MISSQVKEEKWDFKYHVNTAYLISNNGFYLLFCTLIVRWMQMDKKFQIIKMYAT